MPKDIALRCTCGQMHALIREISPGRANRNVCCCASCQAYAGHLGRAEEILDQHGGTDVFQVSPERLSITVGREHLACMQLTDKGALRWYASCCNTPFAHTLDDGKVPFMAMNHLCIDRTLLEAPLDDYVGPIRATVNGEFAKAEAKAHKATAWALVKMILHFAPLVLWWTLRGDRKRSPFFDSKSAAPLVPPRRPSGELVSDTTALRSIAPLPKKVGCG